MAEHNMTFKELPWVMVPVSAALRSDLQALAAAHHSTIGEYCAYALDCHVNGQRIVLDMIPAEKTQKGCAGRETTDPAERDLLGI